jgi:hypothetical protein
VTDRRDLRFSLHIHRRYSDDWSLRQKPQLFRFFPPHGIPFREIFRYQSA